MLRGELYRASDPELRSLHINAQNLTEELNNTPFSDISKRQALIKQLLGTTDEHIDIKSDFHCDYGCNIHVGDHFFANYGCVMLDVCDIRIGNNCMIAPQVGLYTATHPIDPTIRTSGLEYGSPITIGNNCWIGGHATILPGVILGDDVVVAAGAVVTKSFGSSVIIGGNPARVIRKIDI